MHLHLPLSILILIALPNSLHYSAMKVEPSTRLTPDQINKSDYSYTRINRLRLKDTTNYYSVEESGALSRRTSARLDKGLEVHPTIGYKKGLCSFRSRPAIKQKGPWTVLATPDYVKSVLNTTWFMSCIQSPLKQKQLPQPSDQRSYGCRSGTVSSSHTVQPAQKPTCRFCGLSYARVVLPAYKTAGRVDVLGSLSRSWGTRYSNILKKLSEKRVQKGKRFMYMLEKICAIYARAVIINKNVVGHFKVAYVPNPTANQYSMGTVHSIAQFYNVNEMFHCLSPSKIVPSFNVGIIIALIYCVFLKYKGDEGNYSTVEERTVQRGVFIARTLTYIQYKVKQLMVKMWGENKKGTVVARTYAQPNNLTQPWVNPTLAQPNNLAQHWVNPTLVQPNNFTQHWVNPTFGQPNNLTQPPNNNPTTQPNKPNN